MDPSSFHEKDLDDDLEEFIVSWATEYPRHNPIRLVVHLQRRLPGIDAQSVIERAVHNYFAYRTELNGREFKELLREGRLSLIIGLSFPTVCLSGAEMAKRPQIPDASIVEASLTIAGWVAIGGDYFWYPDLYLVGNFLVRLDRPVRGVCLGQLVFGLLLMVLAFKVRRFAKNSPLWRWHTPNRKLISVREAGHRARCPSHITVRTNRKSRPRTN
jgi:hypothetical protein